MIAVIVLVVAVLCALVGVPIRTRLAGDEQRSDADVRRFDLVLAVALGGLVAGAAIAAAVAAPLSHAWLVAGQVIAVAAAAATGGYVVRSVLAFGGIPTRRENFDDPAPDPPLRGGRIIGLMERAAVTVSLLLGWPAGIAVILGIKGLARFPQLREHHASEQFILGTFASVLWACALGGIGVLLGR
ncbi:hypothetical protein ACFQNE_10245 [Gordonia phosphorivorans]|uniref:Uncharacterized protein n=1 Tax=Gordonia phosphorivorans TaxID=1056982 RepID=A0ABV6H979_9ACTN